MAGARMIDLIADNLEEIERICRMYGVISLDLFGSAATGEFDPQTSDLNFIVDMGAYAPGTAFRYLDLIGDLESLLGHEVHIITEPALHDPNLREIIAAQRIRLYEAAHP
jgi:hypothetical protein